MLVFHYSNLWLIANNIYWLVLYWTWRRQRLNPLRRGRLSRRHRTRRLMTPRPRPTGAPQLTAAPEASADSRGRCRRTMCFPRMLREGSSWTRWEDRVSRKSAWTIWRSSSLTLPPIEEGRVLRVTATSEVEKMLGILVAAAEGVWDEGGRFRGRQPRATAVILLLEEGWFPEVIIIPAIIIRGGEGPSRRFGIRLAILRWAFHAPFLKSSKDFIFYCLISSIYSYFSVD